MMRSIVGEGIRKVESLKAKVREESKFQIAARAVAACIDSARDTLDGDESCSRHYLVHGCLDLLETLNLIPELNRYAVNSKLEILFAEANSSRYVEWRRNGVVCSIEFISGVWLAKRNGILVSGSTDRAMAVMFAQSEVANEFEDDGR